MSPFGLKFSQMILHTEASKLMYNWSFLFLVLHKPTLLLSTFNICHSKQLQEGLNVFSDNILHFLKIKKKFVKSTNTILWL